MLTDTGSICLKLIFINDVESEVPDKQFRDILFQISITSIIYDKFDSSHEYWERPNSREDHLRKCLGYFEIEYINNPCFVTVAVNPKEHYEFFEDNSINKKHKRIKKESSGMDFENYARRYLLVNDCAFFFQKSPLDMKQTARLTVIDGEMQQKTVTKTKFLQLNDKRFYFSYGITSLPLSNPNLKNVNEYK